MDYFMNDAFDEFEEEQDAPKKNNRKTLVPLFIRQILEENTNPFKQFTQEDIIERLDEYPYSISIERKALSRDINTLMMAFPNIKKGSYGVYYDKYAA